MCATTLEYLFRMNATFDAITEQEPRETREVPVPAGVGVTRQVRKRHNLGKGRIVPDNEDMLAWLDASTPGWYATLKGNRGLAKHHRVLVFTTSAHAALFKLFWS